MISCMGYFFKACCIQCGPILFVALCGFVIYLLVRVVCKNNDILLSDENLEKNLDDYLSIDKPDFAVMITSRWGLGKTFFIKQYIAKKSSFWAKNKPIYVSLYGIRSEDQLEQELIKSAFPSFNAIRVISIGIIIAGLLNWLVYQMGILFFKDSPKLDLIQFWWPIFLAICFFCYKLFKLKLLKIILHNKSLVFDDFERILVPPEEMLAYINRYVEHLHKHVMVICNEEKMQNNGKDSDNEKYNIVKEKVFGKTFTIEQDQKEIIRSFITQEGTPILYNLIYTHKSFDWFYERSKMKDVQINLRAYRHVIWEFERVFKRVDRKRLCNAKIHKHLIPDFFCLLYSSECIEFPDHHKLSIIQAIEVTKPLEGTDTKEWLKKYFPYAFQSYPLSILPFDCWKALLQHKNFPEQRIDDHWEFLIHGDQRLFVRSFSMVLMSDKEISEFMQDLKEQVKSKELCNPYEILCVVGNLLYHFESESVKILRNARNYISLLEKTNAFPDEFTNLAVFLDFKFNHQNIYENYLMPNTDNNVVKELKTFLTEKLCVFYVQNKKKLFVKYLQQLANYDDEQNLQWWVKHSEVDLFSNLAENAPQLLFDALTALSEKNICYQLSRLRSHFGKIDDKDFDDISFWTRFNEIARTKITEWDAGNKMISKKRALKAFCDSVDKYIAIKKQNQTLRNPEKDSDQ